MERCKLPKAMLLHRIEGREQVKTGGPVYSVVYLVKLQENSDMSRSCHAGEKKKSSVSVWL